MNARHSLAAVLLAIVIVPTPAFADVSDADRATARSLTLEGYESLDRKDFATAADRFRRADALFHVPTVTLGLAHAEVGQGRLVSALATCSRIVREGVGPNAPPAFVKAVEDARREIDALTPRIPNVIITVQGPASATVTIDGVAVPAAALGVKRPVDPGAHVIRAEAHGFAVKEAHVTILEGKVESVTLELSPAKEAPAPVAPVIAPPPPPPPIAAPPPPEPPPPPPSPTQKYVGIAALGVGGAGLLVGAITGGLAIAKHRDLVSQCPGGHCQKSQEASLGSEASAYSTLGAASTGGFIAGGALVATGAILLATAPRVKVTTGAAVSPVVGLGFVGLEGRF